MKVFWKCQCGNTAQVLPEIEVLCANCGEISKAPGYLVYRPSNSFRQVIKIEKRERPKLKPPEELDKYF